MPGMWSAGGGQRQLVGRYRRPFERHRQVVFGAEPSRISGDGRVEAVHLAVEGSPQLEELRAQVEITRRAARVAAATLARLAAVS